MPDPGCSANGLGMNEANNPCESATSLMTVRNVIRLSAVLERIGVAQVDLLLTRSALRDG